MMMREQAEALDRADPLAAFRQEFSLPDGVIYLNGNSLGPLPARAAARVAEAVAREWGEGLIRSWNSAGWYMAPRRLGDNLAGLLGAEPGDISTPQLR